MLFLVIFLSLTIALLGFLGLYDGIQLLVDLPRSFAYFVFFLRIPFIILGLLTFGIALYLGVQTLPLAFIVGYVLLFGGLFVAGFVLQPYLMFISHQNGAQYVTVADALKLLERNAETLVVTQGEEAVVFPHSWISRPRIVGGTLGGESFVMTYCILAHLGIAFRDELGGKRLSLKVLNQLENNMVMFDERSQSLIEHIYGVFAKSRKPLVQLPSTVMPLGSVEELYPAAQVFFNPPAMNPWDNFVRKSQDKLLYGSEGYLNPDNPDPAFPTIAYADQRIPAKEKIYGISLHNDAVAYTLDYIKAAGDVLVEQVGGQTLTLRYYSQYRFLDVFWGNVPEVDAKGYTPDGVLQKRVPHANQVLWIIWFQYYPHTELKF